MTVSPGAARCEGRYAVPQTSPPRDEPFDVTYRCALPAGHRGPHGPLGSARALAEQIAALKSAIQFVARNAPADARDQMLSEAVDGIESAIDRHAADLAQADRDELDGKLTFNEKGARLLQAQVEAATIRAEAAESALAQAQADHDNRERLINEMHELDIHQLKAETARLTKENIQLRAGIEAAKVLLRDGVAREARLREALKVIAECPEAAVHLMPLAAQAALKEQP